MVTSVFVGGGTPSIINPKLLVEVLNSFPLRDDAEVTVECNPDTVSLELFATYVAGGVNRISFGVQSMVPSVLAALGRTHNPASVERAVHMARDAGIKRINLDLIYGGAGETIEQWRETIVETLKLEPDHVSAYALTVEAGTALADDPSRHPDDDDQADKYLIANSMFAEARLTNYEISNWATPSQECEHNLLYWRQGNYLGVGCAAHSHVDGRRWWNVRTPERYIERISAGQSPESSSEFLDEEHRRVEGLQLSLRTREGVPSNSLGESDLEELEGLITRDGDRLQLTVEGRLLANEVAVRLR